VTPFLYTLARLAQLQSEAVDRTALHEAAKAADGQDPQSQLATVCRHLQVKPAQWLRAPDAAAVPALLYHLERGWGLLRGVNAQGLWLAEWLDGEASAGTRCCCSRPICRPVPSPGCACSSPLPRTAARCCA